MNGQYVNGKPIDVSYAYKKDSKSGEKHGSIAERVLAANKPTFNPTHNPQRMQESFTNQDMASASIYMTAKDIAQSSATGGWQ